VNDSDSSITTQIRRAALPLATLAEAADRIAGVRRAELTTGDRLLVATRNSIYRLTLLADGLFKVSGGFFERQGRGAVQLAVAGCTAGGRALFRDIIAAPGSSSSSPTAPTRRASGSCAGSPTEPPLAAVSVPRRVVRDYYRREHLDFFARYRSPFYAISFELEAGALKADLERRRLPTYLNFVWTMTAALQEVGFPLLRGRRGGTSSSTGSPCRRRRPLSFAPSSSFRPRRINRRGAAHGAGRGASTWAAAAAPSTPISPPCRACRSRLHPRRAGRRWPASRGSPGSSPRRRQLWVPVALLVNHVSSTAPPWDGSTRGRAAIRGRRQASAPTTG
jgi:hypothetical protein